MISVAILIVFCFLSLLVGMVMGLGLACYVLKTSEDYEEPDDWPDDDWAKTYEEIKNGH